MSWSAAGRRKARRTLWEDSRSHWILGGRPCGWARVKGPHLDWGLISYSWLYLLLKSVCSTLCSALSSCTERGACYPLPGWTLGVYFIYVGGEIFSGRWSRYFITPLRARWWASLWFYGLLAATFSALSIKRDKASSKLISDSGQNRISGIIQSTFYTHGGLTHATQHRWLAPQPPHSDFLSWCPPPSFVCL
jgi:hypothetical protein